MLKKNLFVIKVKNITVSTIIGCNDYERERKQNIIISYKIKAESGNKDLLKDSVDYDTLTQKIINEVEKTDFKLLESLVDFVLKIILDNKMIETAKVKITKPKALYMAKSVSISKKQKKLM